MGLLLIVMSTVSAAVLGVEPGSGRLAFALPSSLHTVEGQALGFSGKLDTDRLNGRLTVDPAALTTGLGPRDSRMAGYCLETARYPTIELVVTRIEGAVAGLRSGAGAGTVTLSGTLTIRDVERPVAIPATYAWEGDNLRMKGRHDMKWSDWNIPDPSTLLSKAGSELTVSFDVLARPS
ncbi:MAG: YceI family protein [Myxococcota bacterium]